MADGSVKIDILVDDGDAKKKINKVGNEAEETAKDVDKLGDAADDAEEGLEDLGKGAESAEKGIGALDVAAGQLVANGLTALASKLVEAVGALVSLEEETREYREDMAKLDAAFESAGHSTEAARGAYTDFYAILGESDRSVEAVNHLAELTKNEEELAKWSTIAAGVTARFGDSLPIEGLTEAANETAKVGKVTGPLADALNWAGISEDEFNAKLAACNSEQERATLITNTLTAEYEAAAEAYNKNAAEIQNLRRAEAELTEAQAEMGAAMSPLIALYKTGLAGALSGLVPHVSLISEGLQDMFNGVEGGPEKVAQGISGALTSIMSVINSALPSILETGVSLIGSLTDGIVSALPTVVSSILSAIPSIIQGILSASQSILDMLPSLLESIMSQLPVLLPQLISGVVSLIVMLCESFSSIIQPIIDYLPDILISVVTAIMDNLPLLISGLITLIMGIVEAIPQIIEGLVDALPTLISAIISGLLGCLPQIIGGLIQVVWGVVKSLPSIFGSLIEGILNIFVGIWQGITDAFAPVGEWFAEKFEAAKEGIQNAWDSVVDWFSGIWDGITGVFSSVGSWFKDKFNSAVEGIKNAWSSVKQWFTEKWESIKNVFSKAKDDFLSIGKNIVDGIKQGIKDKWENLKKWFSDLFGDLKSIAKKILGINSPSKEFAWIGEMTTAGLEKGIRHGGAKAVDAVKGVGAEMLKAAKKSADKQVKALEEQLDYLEEIRTEKNKTAIDEQKKQLQKELEIARERQKTITTFANTYEKQLSDLLKLEEDYNKKHQDIVEGLASDSEKAIERYQSTFDSRVNSIRNSLGLFDEVEKKEAVSRWDMTKALSSQVKELERYNEALSRLWNREGVSAAFYEEFSQLGVDYLPQLEAINKMTDVELARYVELWEEKTALATEAATKELAGERGRLNVELKTLRDDAMKEADTLKTEYNGAMLELLGEIAAGMLTAGEAGIEALGETVSGYVETGAALMEGVAEGMESKQSEIINQAVSAVRAALAAAREEADINSPSRKTRDLVGAPLAEGVAVGWEEKLAKIRAAMAGGMSGLTDGLRATVSAENARFGYSAGAPDTGFSELARAVNVQTAGLNSLASSTRAGNTRPIVLMLDERELGHAFVDVGNTERARVGTRLVTGGAL